jgi:hypothetical protein
VNTGLPVDRIERRIRRAVPRVPIIDVTSHRDIASRRDRGFAAYRPRVQARADHRPAVVYPALAERRTPLVDSRSGRGRMEVGGSRPAVRTVAPRVERHAVTPQRKAVETRRVASRPPAARSPAKVRVEQHGVGRSPTIERRSVVTERVSQHPAARSVQPGVRQHQAQVQRTVRPPQVGSHAPSPKKRGNGRPPGG